MRIFNWVIFDKNDPTNKLVKMIPKKLLREVRKEMKEEEKLEKQKQKEQEEERKRFEAARNDPNAYDAASSIDIELNSSHTPLKQDK